MRERQRSSSTNWHRADDTMMRADADCPNAVLADVVYNQELCVDVSDLLAKLQF